MVTTNFEMKKNNTVTVFKLIQNHSPISKRELEKLSRLSWGTISYLTNELLSQGFLSTAKSEELALGRTPNMLKINPDKNLCLGIDINIIGLSFVVCDLSGKIKDSSTVTLLSNKKEDILNLLFENTQKFIERYPSMLCISLSMQGQIDKKNGISLKVDYFEDWKNVDIKKMFEDRFNIKTCLYHDPDCLMTYHIKNNEQYIAAKNCILLKLDEGIGMSLRLQGKIYEGSGGIVSEIGHTVIVPKGLPCQCGKSGCLEAYCSLNGLTKQYNLKHNTKLTTNQFEELLDNSNQNALSLLKDTGYYLGISLSNLISILNPQIICIDGLMSKYAQYFIGDIQSAINEGFGSVPKIFAAEFKREAPALGASLKTITETLELILFPVK